MSHHLDTPLAAKNGQLYIDDLYVFLGRNSTILVMDVNSNNTGVYAKPGFHPEARYEFKVHVDNAVHEDLTYRVTFSEPDAAGEQALQMHVLTGAAARDDEQKGDLVLEGRTGMAAPGEGARLWAGRILDAFYIDLSLLTIVNGAVGKGVAPDLSMWDPAQAKNGFDGTSVQSIVIEVPHDDPRLRPGTQIGVWCATKLATDAGGWRQINRGGHPMMWPLFWPTDTDFSNPANARHPFTDFTADRDYVAQHVAAVARAGGTTDDPDAYGEAVANELLPDVLPYSVGSQATFDTAARNGRNRADNVPEVMMSLVTNMWIESGLKPDVSAAVRIDQFPYVVPV
jgi:hypothetical protein